MATKRKRLVRGKDWHAWALRWTDNGEFTCATFSAKKPGHLANYEWVRVKLVPIETRRKP